MSYAMSVFPAGFDLRSHQGVHEVYYAIPNIIKFRAIEAAYRLSVSKEDRPPFMTALLSDITDRGDHTLDFAKPRNGNGEPSEAIYVLLQCMPLLQALLYPSQQGESSTINPFQNFSALQIWRVAFWGSVSFLDAWRIVIKNDIVGERNPTSLYDYLCASYPNAMAESIEIGLLANSSNIGADDYSLLLDVATDVARKMEHQNA